MASFRLPSLLLQLLLLRNPLCQTTTVETSWYLAKVSDTRLGDGLLSHFPYIPSSVMCAAAASQTPSCSLYCWQSGNCRLFKVHVVAFLDETRVGTPTTDCKTIHPRSSCMLEDGILKSGDMTTVANGTVIRCNDGELTQEVTSASITSTTSLTVPVISSTSLPVSSPTTPTTTTGTSISSVSTSTSLATSSIPATTSTAIEVSTSSAVLTTTAASTTPANPVTSTVTTSTSTPSTSISTTTYNPTAVTSSTSKTTTSQTPTVVTTTSPTTSTTVTTMPKTSERTTPTASSKITSTTLSSVSCSTLNSFEWVEDVGCVFISNNDKSWDHAKKMCENKGSILASPDDFPALKTYVQSLTNNVFENYWVGVQKPSGWLSERPVETSELADGNPNGSGDCGNMRRSKGLLLVYEHCSTSYKYICQGNP